MGKTKIISIFGPDDCIRYGLMGKKGIVRKDPLPEGLELNLFKWWAVFGYNAGIALKIDDKTPYKMINTWQIKNYEDIFRAGMKYIILIQNFIEGKYDIPYLKKNHEKIDFYEFFKEINNIFPIT